MYVCVCRKIAPPPNNGGFPFNFLSNGPGNQGTRIQKVQGPRVRRVQRSKHPQERIQGSRVKHSPEGVGLCAPTNLATGATREAQWTSKRPQGWQGRRGAMVMRQSGDTTAKGPLACVSKHGIVRSALTPTLSWFQGTGVQ